MKYIRKKKYWVLGILLFITVAWVFRYDGMLWFQYMRLKSIACSEETSNTCRDKIWAHRVNAMERLQKLEPHFAGFEIDVVYDSTRNSLLVYHPPFEGRVILLESFLKKIAASNKKSWLDLRYVSGSNVEKVQGLLAEMEKKWHFMNFTVIEVYDTAAANYLAKKGYQMAINVPVYGLHSERDWIEFASSVSPQVKYVSQEDTFFPQLKLYFPGKRIILWAVAFKNYFWLDHLEKLVNEKVVEVVLVNVKSRYRY
jgi:hypothetical protein